jgi:hypothetical protein
MLCVFYRRYRMYENPVCKTMHTNLAIFLIPGDLEIWFPIYENKRILISNDQL